MTFIEFKNYIFFLYDYSDYCLVHSVGWVGCNKFWGVVYLVSILICLTVFILCLISLVKSHLEFKRYLARKAERAKVADSETMARHIWNGEF